MNAFTGAKTRWWSKDCCANCKKVEQAARQNIVFIRLHPPAFAGAFDEIKTNLKPGAIVTPQEVSAGLEAMVMGAVQTMTAANLPSACVMDLIPVKPLSEDEAAIKGFYHTRLEALYAKLKS